MAESPNPEYSPEDLPPRDATRRAGTSAHDRGQPERDAARRLQARGRFEEAIACWQRIERADPRDAEAPRMIAELTLEKNRCAEEPTRQADTPGGPAEEASAEVEPPRTGTVAGTAAKPRKLVLTPRQELEQAIRDNPEEEENYLALADLLLQERRTYEAQQTLTKAANMSRSLRILERLEEVNLLRAGEQVEIARQRAAEDKTSTARDHLKQLEEAAQQLELQICRARCERYPQDRLLRFQLGSQLKATGSFQEALDALQAGLELPEHRPRAALEIGEILQSFHRFPEALRSYRQAAQAAADRGGEIRKTALYRAGVLATAMQLNDSAAGYLGQLVREDPAYKDARTRLDKLREIDETA